MGTLDFPTYSPPTENPLKDIIDSRCSSCEILWGKHKEMEFRYERKFGRDGKFNEFMKKCEYKKLKFDKELEKAQ